MQPQPLQHYTPANHQAFATQVRDGGGGSGGGGGGGGGGDVGGDTSFELDHLIVQRNIL